VRQPLNLRVAYASGFEAWGFFGPWLCLLLQFQAVAIFPLTPREEV